jgi:hypothetical protein
LTAVAPDLGDEVNHQEEADERPVYEDHGSGAGGTCLPRDCLVGHRDTAPGQNFIYVHLNRVVEKCDLDMFYIAIAQAVACTGQPEEMTVSWR